MRSGSMTKQQQIKEKKLNTRSGNMVDNTMREADRLGTVGPIVKVLGMMQLARSRHTV